MNDPEPAAYREIALLIAGNNTPPAWLVNGIPTAIYFLNGNIRVENSKLTKKQWRKRYKKAADCAKHLLTELQDYKPNDGFLVMLMNSPSIYERQPYETDEMLEALKALVARCEEKIGRLATKRGGKKVAAEIDKTPDGKVLCALAVSLAWKRIKRQWPGVDNSDAHSACEKLWKEAGGRRYKSDTISKSWRNQFERARNYRTSYQANYLMRMWAGMQKDMP